VRITVIMPTITGREEMLARMVQAYRDRTPGHDLETLNPKDHPNWPSGCNAGQLVATGEVFHFTNDDIEPLDGWAEPMLEALARGEVPAPQVWNWTREGPPVNERQDGPPGSFTAFSRLPSLTREMAERVGPWPSIDYYGDNWVSDAARILGFETRVMAGYAFIHHWHQHGRLDHGDWVGRNLPLYNAERAKLGLGPVGR
jgi:hypothetical protein